MLNLFRKTQLTKTIFFVVADIFSVVISVWLAFLLRFDFNIPAQYIPFIYRMIELAIIFILPIFYFKTLFFFLVICFNQWSNFLVWSDINCICIFVYYHFHFSLFSAFRKFPALHYFCKLFFGFYFLRSCEVF